MKSWEWSLDVLAQLETKLSQLTDESGDKVFQEVVVGWRAAHTKIPAVYVLPDIDLLTPPSVAANYHRLRYILRVLSEKVTKKGSLQDAVKLAGRVDDMVAADRRLNNAADNTEVLRWEYNALRVREYGRHSIELVVEFRRYFIPS